MLADPTVLATVAALCLFVIALSVRSLRRGAAEDARVASFLRAIQDVHPHTELRTDTAAFPRIVLAGTVAG